MAVRIVGGNNPLILVVAALEAGDGNIRDGVVECAARNHILGGEHAARYKLPVSRARGRHGGVESSRVVAVDRYRSLGSNGDVGNRNVIFLGLAIYLASGGVVVNNPTELGGCRSQALEGNFVIGACAFLDGNGGIVPLPVSIDTVVFK